MKIPPSKSYLTYWQPYIFLVLSSGLLLLILYSLPFYGPRVPFSFFIVMLIAEAQIWDGPGLMRCFLLSLLSRNIASRFGLQYQMGQALNYSSLERFLYFLILQRRIYASNATSKLNLYLHKRLYIKIFLSISDPNRVK
jgi:hypothetical protein